MFKHVIKQCKDPSKPCNVAAQHYYPGVIDTGKNRGVYVKEWDPVIYMHAGAFT